MIKQAQVQWSNGTPISTEFDDVYFSKINGVDETRFIFIEGSQLPQRWRQTTEKNFSICETGFGTGLNFLCAWDSWLQNSQAPQQLNFLSVEKFPLAKQDLKKALAQWPEFSELSQQLIDQYPPMVPGWHTLHFKSGSKQGDVNLHLFFGDIQEWLPQIQGPVDAWFLDGFTPSRNPEMWNDNLYLHMAHLTKTRGTVATFSAAGDVKRRLSAAGFTVIKTKGYQTKREMGYAVQTFNNGPQEPFYIHHKPWFESPKTHQDDRSAIVIGGGIAGCCTAFSLAKRGWKVKLFERHEGLANGASGNTQGVLYAKLATSLTPHSQFYLAGYLYSLNLLKTKLNKEYWDDCGVLQLALDEKEIKRQSSFTKKNELSEIIISVNASQASDIACIDIKQPGLFFKNGAWVYPKALCEALVKHKNIEVHLKTEIEHIHKEKSGKWQATTKNKTIFQSQVLVVCCAMQSLNFKVLDFLPIKPVAGQVSQASAKNLKLNTVLCGGGYVTPTLNGQLNFGASYRLNSEDIHEKQQDHIKNLMALSQEFPSVAKQLGPSPQLKGRASVRCTTQDYTPIAGPICDQKLFMQDFKALEKNRKWKFYKQATFLKGLYVNLGHGSRGLSSAPICAELVAAQINQDPWPMAKDLANLINPNRFLVKQFSKE